MVYPLYNFSDPSLDYSLVETTVKQMYADLLSQGKACCFPKATEKILCQVDCFLQAASIDGDVDSDLYNEERWKEDVKNAYELLKGFFRLSVNEVSPTPTVYNLNLADSFFIPYIMLSIDGGDLVPAQIGNNSFTTSIRAFLDPSVDPDGTSWSVLVFTNGEEYKWGESGVSYVEFTPLDSNFLGLPVDLISNIPYDSSKELSFSVASLINGDNYTIRIGADTGLVLDVNNPSTPVVGLPSRMYEDMIQFAVAYHLPFHATLVYNGVTYEYDSLNNGGSTEVARGFFPWVSAFNVTQLTLTEL